MAGEVGGDEGGGEVKAIAFKGPSVVVIPPIRQGKAARQNQFDMLGRNQIDADDLQDGSHLARPFAPCESTLGCENGPNHPAS